VYNFIGDGTDGIGRCNPDNHMSILLGIT